MAKTLKINICEKCDYKSSKLSDFNRHLATQKHKILINTDGATPKTPKFNCICGKIYNEFFNPAPVNDECCAKKYLQKRSDDTLEIAVTRYQTYEKNIEPVINFYKQSNLLKVVNGEALIPQINTEISGLIDSI